MSRYVERFPDGRREAQATASSAPAHARTETGSKTKIILKAF
jgi:hypothetical protein